MRAPTGKGRGYVIGYYRSPRYTGPGTGIITAFMYKASDYTPRSHPYNYRKTSEYRVQDLMTRYPEAAIDGSALNHLLMQAMESFETDFAFTFDEKVILPREVVEASLALAATSDADAVFFYLGHYA